jgi:5-methylcytosine-specific restriction endonuclease McrA
MTPSMSASLPGKCWICGATADSDEHKYKRTDIVTRYGRSWPSAEQPFVFRGDGRPSRIPGPNSEPTLYRDMLCQPCNNARTKPFDLAYERFSTWVLSGSNRLHERTEIDFAEVFVPLTPKKQ